MSFLYYTVGESHWPFMSQYDKKGTTSIICAIIIKVNSWNKNANCPKYQFCFQKDTENNHIRDSANYSRIIKHICFLSINTNGYTQIKNNIFRVPQ